MISKGLYNSGLYGKELKSRINHMNNFSLELDKANPNSMVAFGLHCFSKAGCVDQRSDCTLCAV